MECLGDPQRDSHFTTISTVNSLTGSSVTLNMDNKFSKMKKLIVIIENYIETRSDDKIIAINQLLQALSLTADLSIFDPHTNIAGKLFISIYDLMNTIEPNSSTSWYCIDLLLNACKNPATRQILKATYQFLPCLACMIGDQLTNEKKCRLLRLMQEITCGIKVYCQLPHTARLMTILCKWIESQESEVVTVALGVLVNLCYKNMSNVYVMQRNIDLKKFIRMCLALKGPIVKVYVNVLTIILENISEYMPAVIYPQLTDNTFTAVKEEYRKNNSLVLKQIIEFFIECVKSNLNLLSGYDKYGEQVESILDIIEKQGHVTNNPECLSTILDLLNFLVESKVSQISCNYPRIIHFALNWVQDNTLSYKAINILRTVIVNLDKKESKTAESLVTELNVFLKILNSSKEEGVLHNTENIIRLRAILQLFTAMIEVKPIRSKVIKEIDEDAIKSIFQHILGDTSPYSCENSCSTDLVNLYINGVSLVATLAQHDNRWVTLINTLIENRKIHIIIAQAISHGPVDVKTSALEISSLCPGGISLALGKLQPILPTDKSFSNPSFSLQQNDMALSIIPVGQNERLQALLENIESLLGKNEVNNLATSELMELYNYRISYLSQAERVALCSLDASTKHCTHLQHRISRLTYENMKLQQSELYTVQKLEEVSKKKQEISVDLRDFQNRCDVEKGKNKALHSQNIATEKALTECQERLNNTESKLAKLQLLFDKVKENCKRLEKNEEKKDESIRKANETISDLMKQVNALEKSLNDKEKLLEDTRNALHLKTTILDSITKMANSQAI
ncbi:protein CIP2A-like [Euwallacea fornicatus]|uniref:protein CIP2A-like n=1 Tax=Euwallacea fornicatus TaxID=995702 RepID=UPI00338FEB86